MRLPISLSATSMAKDILERQPRSWPLRLKVSQRGKPATTPVIPSDASIDLIRRAIDLVQHLDPAGVGARDLRESLMLQIAAQQQEFEQLYGAPLPEPVEADPHGPNPHGSLSDEADRRIEERRRAMQVAAVICDRHLHLLQKRDMKELARAVQVPVEDAPGRGVHSH